MKTTIILTLLILLNQFNSNAQSTQAFDFVTWPHSVSSFGTGEMGVASLTNDDALVYNPAKLSLTKNTRLSFFRNPFQIMGIWNYPLINAALYHKIDNFGSLGISYENWDFGEVVAATSDHPDGIGKFHYYQRSFSAGFAMDLNENLSAGIQFRYAYQNLYKETQDGFFVSLGLLYNPEIWDKKLTVGFSLMNLGPAVKYESGTVEGATFYDPAPAKLNLGASLIAAENDYFSFPLSLSISKPFDKRDDNGVGQSSFKTLFTDWKDFPNDAALHTGLSFIWKPLYFSDNFAFFQEFYAGNFSDGVKTHLQNYYTHGMNFGLEVYAYKFSAGYAGVSHNVHYPTYFQWVFPYETFQFTFEMNSNLFNNNFQEQNHPALNNIILSFGFGEVIRLGKARTHSIHGFFYDLKYEAENNLNYSWESAFYFKKNQALVTSISYNSIPFSYSLGSAKFLESKIETFSFFSSFRYHFLEDFKFLFLQGGLGIIRMNPVIESEPRYDYHTALQASAGLTLEFLSPFIIMPVLDYNFILNYIAFPPVREAPRILGYNQINFNLKIGYKIF